MVHQQKQFWPLRRTLNASNEGLATTSTVSDDDEGDTSNDEENSNVTVDKNSSYNGMNGKDDVDDEDSNSKSPHASSPNGNHSKKPASNSPLAVRSTDEIGSGHSTSPIFTFIITGYERNFYKSTSPTAPTTTNIVSSSIE